jgi:hypothetical protein
MLALLSVAMALVAAPIEASAQSVGSSVIFPSGWAPGQSICVKQVDGTCVPVGPSLPLPISPRKTTVSSALSGVLATSGATVAIPITNTTRTEVMNPSSATLWASFGTPSVNGAGSFPILPNGSFSIPDQTSGTLTLLATATAQAYTVNRYS